MPHKKEDILKTTSDVLNAYIESHHLNHTPERMMVLAAVCKLQHFSMEQLQSELASQAISRATVYNTLILLEKAEIIQRLEKEFGVRATQYELVQATDSYVHVICQKCGRVSKLKDSTIQRMLADKRWTNFTPKHFSLYIYGQCKICRKKIK